jgi:hypothetical protein
VNPFHAPAIVHPSPIEGTTQSGTSSRTADCSAGSWPTVRLPSTWNGLIVAFRLYQPYVPVTSTERSYASS